LIALKAMGAESYIFVEIWRFFVEISPLLRDIPSTEKSFIGELTAVLELDRSLRSDVFFEHYEVQIVA
jgi:hypothetical protein